MLTLIAKSETFALEMVEINKSEAVLSLLRILLGPGLPSIEFSTNTKRYVILILRQLIKFISAVNEKVMEVE